VETAKIIIQDKKVY